MHKKVSRGYQLVTLLFLILLHDVLGIKGNSRSGPADGLHSLFVNGVRQTRSGRRVRGDNLFRCARKVSKCHPGDCSGDGDCVLGRCECTGFWSGDACDQLTCPHDCNHKGVCKLEGCVCDKGWTGPDCKSHCPVGTYGVNCSALCSCQNEAVCSPLDGSCQCQPGCTGILCDTATNCRMKQRAELQPDQCGTSMEDAMDILVPYDGHHGPHHGNRYVRDCQHVKFGNFTHSMPQSHGGVSKDITLPIVDTQMMIKEVGEYFNKRRVRGHVTYVNNPLYTVSVLEPGHVGSCGNGTGARATVKASAVQKNCLVAVNAGFFDLRNGACLGNIVSDGNLVQDSGGIQNAHFGILKNGSLFFGYLGESVLLESDFAQLVGGVIWLLRDGENYVTESINLECDETETTGTLHEFASVNSARTAVGADKDGRVVVVQVDGKTNSNGMTLYEFAETLAELGVVNAINLDGGGSATFLQNGTVSNYPTDTCSYDERFRCARNVSTVICVHLPDCHPGNCSGHGDCVLGRCVCSGFWSGDACDQLTCPQDCNQNGHCTPEGCVCDKGWTAPDCSSSCPLGTYGQDCSSQCRCQNEAVCSPMDGSCQCQPGYSGILCDSVCPYGYFGHGCRAECYCPGDCACDPFTGSCQYSLNGTSVFKAAYCLMNQMIEANHLVVDQPEQYRLCLTSIIIISCVAAVSVIINISLICMQCMYARQRRRKRRRRQRTYGPVSKNDDSANEGDGENSSDDQSESNEKETSFIEAA